MVVILLAVRIVRPGCVRNENTPALPGCVRTHETNSVRDYSTLVVDTELHALSLESTP